MFKFGSIRLDNRGAENQVRIQALGRHDEVGSRGPVSEYLFAGSHKAASNIAVLYSLLISCKVYAINSREWLTKTLQRLAVENVDELSTWLPNWEK